ALRCHVGSRSLDESEHPRRGAGVEVQRPLSTLDEGADAELGSVSHEDGQVLLLHGKPSAGEVADERGGGGMNEGVQDLLSPGLAAGLGGGEAALLALLIAFCIGHVVAWTYMITHTGLSYSQMFTSSLLVLPVIVALTMMLLSGNILIAFGLLSVFAMIR